MWSGLDMRASLRNLGLLHRFRSRYSEDSFGIFAAIADRPTGAVALAGRSPALPSTVAEAFLLGPSILWRAFLPSLHTSRIGLGAKALVVLLARTRGFWSREEYVLLMNDKPRAGFLIKNDGIPAALRERKIPTNAGESVRSVVPGAALTKRTVTLAIKIRFGRSLWKSLHRMADGWPCDRCRPQTTVWMQGLHDAVNVRLGKPPFRPDSYAQYASGSLERGFHPGCLGCRIARAGFRFLARAPRPQVSTR